MAHFKKAMSETASIAVPRKDLHTHVEILDQESGKSILTDSEHLNTVHKNTAHVKWSPANAVPTTFFTASASIDIKIENYRGVLHDLVIELRLSESGGANSVTPPPASLMFDRIEFFANGGSDLIQTLYGDTLFYNLGTLTTEQLTHVAAVNNQNTSFAGVTAISAGGSARYHVPLIGNFVEQMKGVYLAGLNSYILCRIHSKAAVETGSGTLRTDNIFLWGEVEQMTIYDAEDLDFQYKNSIIEKPILDNQIYQVTQTFAPSTAYSLTLSPFKGEVAFILGGFRSSTANASNGARTYSSIGNTATIELLDSNGQNVTGGSALDYQYLRYIEFPKQFPSTIASSLPLIPLIFGEPLPAISGGKKVGYQYFDTRDQIKITPDANWSSATYTLSLYAYIWRHCHIEKGRIIVYKK